jgi:hypothetical protein
MIAALNRFAIVGEVCHASAHGKPPRHSTALAALARAHEMLALTRSWVEINSYTANSKA